MTGNDSGVKYLQPFPLDEKLTPSVRTNRTDNLFCCPLVHSSHTPKVDDTFDVELSFCAETEPYFEHFPLTSLFATL
jgi:hypothetical protein